MFHAAEGGAGGHVMRMRKLNLISLAVAQRGRSSRMAALASRLTVAVALAFVIRGYYAQTTCEDPQTYVKRYALIFIPHTRVTDHLFM